MTDAQNASGARPNSAPNLKIDQAAKIAEQEAALSTPASPGVPQIGAFYPGFGFPFQTNGVPYPPGVGPFVPVAPQGVHNALFPQASGVPPYGMLYPTHSYDVSIALAALAVGEARALLQSTQELRNTAPTSSPPPQPPCETPKKEEKPESKQSTWRRTPQFTKSRSDVASWRKDVASSPLIRSATVPASDGSMTFLEKFKNSRGRGYTLKDIKSHVALMSLDQTGSRWLQRQLDETRLSGAQIVIGEVLQNTLLLSRDVFGNYIVQKTLEYVDQDNKDAIARSVKGRMRRLSFDVYGCRVVQRLMEHTSTHVAVELCRELEEVVSSCVLDANASHVVQKCIEFLPSDQIAFLLEPLCDNIKATGSSPAGCRVVQRLVEYCSLRDLRERILDEIIDNVTDLATSEYGNYVVQHVAQHGGPKHRTKALHRIGTNFRLLSHHRYASRVVERFLSHVEESERRYMIESMFAIGSGQFLEESWVLDMMQDPFANYIIQKILEVGDAEIQSMLVKVIKANRCALKEGFGKRVMDAAINMSLLTASDLVAGTATRDGDVRN